MVIWRHGAVWNGFGVFGQGRRGKTTVTFEFALQLLKNDMLDFRIFDDNFLLFNSIMKRPSTSPYGDWGCDRVGRITDFEREARTKGKKLTDFKPIDQPQYPVNDATIWFLSPRLDLQEVVRNPCGFDAFLELLAANHPCHNEEWQPTSEKLLPSFNASWRYEQVYLQTSIEMLTLAARMAYQTVFGSSKS